MLTPHILDKLERHIIASDPRVTRFPIDWGDGLLDGCPEPEQPTEDNEESNLLGNEEQVENISQLDQENEDQNNKLEPSSFCEGQSGVQFIENTSCMPLHPVQSSNVPVDTF
ncbi:unnamed protein product [Schistosoma curassoni]|uniref:Uncharacterized protein n=1 Tax=Schistosoma curassoni TaxID=6186 RepID=A0A183L208_9TREM|nr:unnamed protein product [Schistosoma curassoni]